MSEKFTFKSKTWLTKDKTDVVLKCMDWDRFKADDRLGLVSVPIKSVEEAKAIDQWFPLRPQKPGDVVAGELHVRLEMNDDSSEFTPSDLWRAVKRAEENVVLQILPFPREGEKLPPGVDLNERDGKGETLLHLAAQTGKADIIERLLGWQISLTTPDNEGNTPLHAFCRHFAYPSEILEKFLANKSLVNAQNNFGETPLHHVVFNRSIKLLVAEELLKAGADPNIVALNKDAPLHYAVQMGRTDLVKLLIAYGADCNLPGSKGFAAVALAKSLDMNAIADVIQDALHVVHYLKKLELPHLIWTFLDQEIYIHHLEDIPESTLGKIVKNKDERDKIIAGIKELKTLERKETFWKRQEILSKQREELRKKESKVRNLYQKYVEDSKLEWEIDISDLEFLQSLGHGASGAVYKGTMNNTLPVAIKVLKNASVDSEKEITEFIREFSIAIKVQSPYTVHFYGATLKTKLCMVMELCEKGSLYTLLKDPEFSLDWKLAFSMLSDTCMGIQALHSNNILHRDLKTLNVLVSGEYRCKVCDFGLSRFNTESNAASLMKCRGTLAYVAKEVYKGEGYFVQSDVYSIAIMVWEFINKIITGTYTRPYHEIMIEFAILRKAHDENVRPVIPAGTPPSVKALITTAWHPDWRQRPDVPQLLDGIEQLRKEYEENAAEWNILCKSSKGGQGLGGSESRPKIRRGGGGALNQQSVSQLV
eukprot:TRINITY_DN9446_c0_g1_i2.p1 TRINITY_DN9446_c0_g1~~TRINITY_DN9446_c0_g1_i2.p1  ORF type:complete len:776 (+),score=196.67 TRINITY_DN9446_c0_g1_i2:209-2329(+)